MKYRSQWPTFVLRSNVWLFYACMFLSFCSSSWCRGLAAVCDCGIPWTFLWTSFALYFEDYLMYEHHSAGLWVITNKQMYEKQGHWTLKNRSCWPWLYDPQVSVTRLSHVSLTIFISCFHNRKVEKHFLKVSLILTSSPTLGHGPWGQESWNEIRPSRVPMVQIWMFSDEWLERYTPLEKL